MLSNCHSIHSGERKSFELIGNNGLVVKVTASTLSSSNERMSLTISCVVESVSMVGCVFAWFALFGSLQLDFGTARTQNSAVFLSFWFGGVAGKQFYIWHNRILVICIVVQITGLINVRYSINQIPNSHASLQEFSDWFIIWIAFTLLLTAMIRIYCVRKSISNNSNCFIRHQIA